MTTAIATLNNLQNFHAMNPEARERFEIRMKTAIDRYESFMEGASKLSSVLVPTAENMRQFGEAMTAIESELPGGKFTRDFYEQMNGWMVDGHAQTITFERIEFAIKFFKTNPDPITTVTQALQISKPVREIAGELDFKLDVETHRGHHVEKPDELKVIYGLMDESTWESSWENFKHNPNYFDPQTGKVVEHQRNLIKERAQTLFRIAEEMREALE